MSKKKVIKNLKSLTVMKMVIRRKQDEDTGEQTTNKVFETLQIALKYL
ncbi:MAG: hypothetical protein ICV56_04480 [Nitrososphaeraceae archaeon]|nr:hypothetical protein [Nitrososphaeraceae archaeon]